MGATEIFAHAFKVVPWVAIVLAVSFFLKLKKR